MNASKFTPLGYNYFVSLWHCYYQENFSTFKEEVDLLLLELTPSEQKDVTSFINTILFKVPTPTSNYLIRAKYLQSTINATRLAQQKLTKEELRQIRLKYQINPKFLIQTSVFKFHNGLKLLPPYIKKALEGKTFIDAGAYFGDSSLVFSPYKPQKIISLEPCPINFGCLQETIAHNNLQALISPKKVGVGERVGKAFIHYNSSSWPNLGANLHNPCTNSHLSPYFEVEGETKRRAQIPKTAVCTKQRHRHEIDITTIDNIVQEEQIAELGLVKLDIEGCELEALYGAKRSILKYQPVLLIAVYHSAEEFLKIKPLLRQWVPGYKFVLAPLDLSDLLQEFYLIAYLDPSEA